MEENWIFQNTKITSLPLRSIEIEADDFKNIPGTKERRSKIILYQSLSSLSFMSRTRISKDIGKVDSLKRHM